MFIIGTGRDASAPRPYRLRMCACNGVCAACAAARASAIDTPRIAFAPSRALFGVPSSSIRKASSAR
jgi:hypothetical protein